MGLCLTLPCRPSGLAVMRQPNDRTGMAQPVPLRDEMNRPGPLRHSTSWPLAGYCRSAYWPEEAQILRGPPARARGSVRPDGLPGEAH
jgi:hypothetical protein